MYQVHQKSLSGPPRCLLHPNAVIRWKQISNGWPWRSFWACDGCAAVRAARRAKQRAKPPMFRTRPIRVDPATTAEIVGRVLALATPAAATNVYTSFEAAERLLMGIVSNVDNEIERAMEVADSLSLTRRARFGDGLDTYVWREDLALVASRARADVSGGARRHREAWSTLRAELARRDDARDCHPYAYTPAALHQLEPVYLAYATDEARIGGRSRGPRIASTVVREMLTKPLLVLPPPEEPYRYKHDFCEEP